MVVKWLIQNHRDIKIQSWDSKGSQIGFRTQVNKKETEDRRPTQQWPLSPALSKSSSERESEEKAHVIILRSLRTTELGIWWERRASPELQVQNTDSLQELCRTWLGPSYFCNVVPFSLQTEDCGNSRSLCLAAGSLPDTKDSPTKTTNLIFFSSQCLSSLPPMPTILAWVSQLSPRCGLFEKTYGILVQPGVHHKGKLLFIRLDWVTFFMQE